MKKRKAKRRKIPMPIIDDTIDEALTEEEVFREAALLNFIANIIVQATLRDLDKDEI